LFKLSILKKEQIFIKSFYFLRLMRKNDKTSKKIPTSSYLFRIDCLLPSLVDLKKKLDKGLYKNKDISCLSLPCSGGYEVYSLAIFLELEKEKGNLRDYTIVGADIDEQLINIAILGIYRVPYFNVLSYASTKKFQDLLNVKEEKIKEFVEFDIGNFSSMKINKERFSGKIKFYKLDVLKEEITDKLGEFDLAFYFNLCYHLKDEDRITTLKNILSSLKKRGYLYCDEFFFKNVLDEKVELYEIKGINNNSKQYSILLDLPVVIIYKP